MSFYLYAKEHAGRIYHRFIDDNGLEQTEIIEDTDLYLAEKTTADSEFKDMFGTNVKPYHFTNIRDFKNYYNSQKHNTNIVGIQKPILQFINERYAGRGRIIPDIKKIRVLNFDIETSCAPGESFPNPNNPIVEIISISFKLFGLDQRVTMGFKPYVKQKETDIYIQCENEKDLLLNAIKYIRKVSPHVLTGWNIDRFDIPYLITRCRKIVGEDYTNLLSPFPDHWNAINEFNGIYTILGITIIDYMVVYKKYQMEMLPSYRLDYVGQFEGVGGKDEYMEKWGSLHNFYINDFQGFIQYNERDVEVVEKIDEKRGFIELLFIICYINMTPIEDYFFATRGWDASIYHELWKTHEFVPMKVSDTMNEKASGAFVFDPKTGLHCWVFGIDANSLYPTLMDELNLSPETLVDKTKANFENYILYSDKIKAVDVEYKDIFDAWLKGEVIKDTKLPQTIVDSLIQPAHPDYITAGNGVLFRKDKKGVIPKLVRNAVTERKGHNNEKKRLEAYVEELKASGSFDPDIMEKSLTQIKIEHALQLALKIYANSVYGACLEPNFRYFQKELGEAITGSGRFVLFSTHGHVNKLFNNLLNTVNVDYIIYGDTDSLYIHAEPILKAFYKGDMKDTQAIIDWIDLFVNNVVTPYLGRVFQVIQRFTNANESLLYFKREAIIDKGIWVAKKRYVVRIMDNEGVRYKEPYVKHTGIETVRSTTPIFWKDKITDLIDIYLNKGEDDCVKHFRDMQDGFLSCDFMDWVSISGINKINNYMGKNSGPAHIMGAVTFNRYLKKHNINHIPPISDGGKIKWVYLNKLGVAKYGYHVLAFPDADVLNDIGLTRDHIDLDKMYLKGAKSLHSLAQVTGWPTTKLEQIQSQEILF